MNRKVFSKDRLEIAALVAIFILVAAIWFKTSSPVAKLNSSIGACGLFIDIVSPSLVENDSFSNVELSIYTGNGGSVLVTGWVSSHKVKDQLIRFLEERYPPRPLVFRLWVGGTLESKEEQGKLFDAELSFDLVHPEHRRVESLEDVAQ